MKKFIALFGVMAVMATGAQALTLKKGEVIGGDGKIYEGASPEVQENLIANAKRTGKNVGVSAGNVFVIVGEEVTYVSTKDLAGKSKDAMVEVVGNAVVENVTGVEGLTLEEIENISAETGISVENIQIVEQITANFSEELAEDMIAGIQEAVESGLAEQVNEFLGSLTDDEIDLLSRFSSLEECQAAGASGCEEMDEKMNNANL